ncbi:MAG: heavy-metal-associated domain-containing protein [Amylibacter sp.]|nr:heavy-metal-associated domain-containing protein [Amylibacter sp.]
MRMIFTTVFVLALTISQTAFAGQTYSLQVDGLACPFCAYGIEKQLLSVDGVQDVVVDLNAGSVQVTMQDGSTLNQATAKQAVKDAGFTLKGFNRAPE